MKESSKFETKKIIIPQKCPSCGANLIFSETKIDLYCPNEDNCPAQILGRLSYFCQRNIGNISGLSEKILAKFMEIYNIKDIPDLYNLPFDKIANLEGFGKKSADNLKKSIEKSKLIESNKFLAGLGIEGIGPEIAKLICDLILQKKDDNFMIKNQINSQDKSNNLI